MTKALICMCTANVLVVNYMTPMLAILLGAFWMIAEFTYIFTNKD